MPILVFVALTLLCFVATGFQPWPALFVFILLVPAAVRTCLIRAQHSDDPLTITDLLFQFLLSVGRMALVIAWFGLVVVSTHTIKQESIVVVPPVLLGLALWLVYLLRQRRTSPVVPRDGPRIRWRQGSREWLTIRGMLILVALIAFLLWPVHLWWTRDVRRATAANEELLASMCEAESRLMAERAEECRRRVRAGETWNANDEATEGLKLSPYPGENPGRSWLEQSDIWERAAERGRQAAQRHRNRAG